MKNLKPFDFQAALSGKAVMLRNGGKAYVRHHETELLTETDETLLGYLEGVGTWSWSAYGKSRTTGDESKYDIVGMYQETRTINGFEVPAPETEAPKHGTSYYLPFPTRLQFHSCESWGGAAMDKIWLERGLVYLTAEDAIATAKAMLGIDPHNRDWKMNANQHLQAAIACLAERGKQYDNPEGERSMEAAVDAFEAVTGHSLTVTQGWLFMALLKAVRTQQGDYKADSFIDGAAYFALAGESAAQTALADWDAAEKRMEAIGRNGPTGEHYPGSSAPPHGW